MTELPIEALADEAAERLMRYARIDTQSDKHSTAFPSTEKQWDLLRLLRDELLELGLADVDLDEHGYLFATVPATVRTTCPRSGFSRTSTRRRTSRARTSSRSASATRAARSCCPATPGR